MGLVIPSRLGWVAGAAMVGLILSPGAQADDGSARIVVDCEQVLGEVNPMIFGNNLEAADVHFEGKVVHKSTGDGVWDPAAGAPVPEIVDASKSLGVTVWRYPGGCLVHGFDWKQAVGPVEDRPNFVFGVDEFLEFCEATSAEPLITVSDYSATPEDSANLVEYLNAPAEPRYPWAMKRAAWGRKEPWGVTYFEMGNETDHGTHDNRPKEIWSASEYVTWFNDAVSRMKAIDPRIQVGALTGTNTGPQDRWNTTVAAGVNELVDFFIVHTYAVHLSTDEPGSEPPALVMGAALAATEDLARDLPEYHRVLTAAAGRELPLAITEYNASMIQPDDDPLPFRLTWGTAMFCGDYLRILLAPENRILMANYWHLLNGYWGFLRGPEDVSAVPPSERVWKKYPAYEVFRLWAEHRGHYLVKTSVTAPSAAFPGYGRTRAKGNEPDNLLRTPEIDLTVERSSEGAIWTSEGDAGQLELKNFVGEQYLEFGSAPVTGGASYRVEFEARFQGEPGTLSLGLGVMDQRGWEATRSAIAIPGVESAKEWQKFSGDMPTRNDADGIALLWRLLNKSGSGATGSVEIRNLTIQALPISPPYPLLTATAMVSEDQKSLRLIVFNKDGKRAIPTTIDVQRAAPGAARIWTVSAPSWITMNVGPGGVEEVVSGDLLRELKPSSFSYAFPPRSMSAIEIPINSVSP